MAPLTGHYCLKSLLSHSYYDFNIVYYHCILANLQLIKLIFLWWNFNCYFIQFSLSFPSHLFITPTSIAVAIHSLRIILFCVCVAIPIDGYFTTLELRALSKFPQRGNNYWIVGSRKCWIRADLSYARASSSPNCGPSPPQNQCDTYQLYLHNGISAITLQLRWPSCFARDWIIPPI